VLSTKFRVHSLVPKAGLEPDDSTAAVAQAVCLRLEHPCEEGNPVDSAKRLPSGKNEQGNPGIYGNAGILESVSYRFYKR
jgi:hypothetical protein